MIIRGTLKNWTEEEPKSNTLGRFELAFHDALKLTQFSERVILGARTGTVPMSRYTGGGSRITSYRN